MLSRGVIDGSEINGFAMNGGNFVQDASATFAATANASLKATRRLVSSGASTVTFGGAMRVVVRGLRLSATAAFGGTAEPTRRLVAKAQDNATATATATGTRRVKMIVSDAASAAGAMAFSITWTKLTEIRRVMRVRDQRSMRVQPERRAMVMPRRDGPMIVPAAAGDMP
ncbi:hypothetical protein I6F11_04040 [Ensifer sp. NBAIM29]|nr:hypothetical protein [Ensifer sp. NBAIM29]